ncbi:PilL N-terminal domain-containing protein [Edwardsiella ictaluri]|uniref:PilL N-terminal domain-containing protein n=1 Tax=Edwardsiella ictaluri TaxID=67780 RepID=A0A1S6R001_EDWIC|nr:PilL N-terminal domain-containing protein [Edwardsiella ictaluri]AQW41067.1 PilL protein [Edwardsiella ictaluri]ELV7529425.1 PilL N-terminal domain-containing protein [Edwardsiella ictaluri]KOO54019.1 lipoprotein [Edwardsiella ictaluri]WFN97914.1 PilL N-terminal domain-containing protein [Edwardsiella ictaluri]
MNFHIPMAFCLAASLLTGCTQKLQQPDTRTHPTALNGNVQPVRSDVYAVAPEVVRYDRYLLIDTSPRAAQRAPLEQTIDIRIPASLSPTVADAMRYALRQSGYSLCGTTPANQVLYNQMLPAVHYQLGPMRLSQALQILAGSAWQLEVDSVQRIVCHSLRDGYRLPPETVKTSVTSLSVPLPTQPANITVPAPQRMLK